MRKYLNFKCKIPTENQLNQAFLNYLNLFTGWKIENVTRDKEILSAFNYTSSADSGEYFEQMGALEHYETGGYIIDINNRYKKAKNILSRLNDSSWLDDHTRCLFICLNTYNTNNGLYMQTIIQMEKLFLRNVLPMVKVISFKLYPFVNLWDYLILLFLAIFVCITIANTISLVIYVWNVRKLSWEVLLSLLSLISSFMIIVGYSLKIDQLLTIRDNLITNPGQ